MEVDLPFLLCFTLYMRAILQVQAPGGGGLYLEGLIFLILGYLIIQPMATLFRFDRLDLHTLADTTLQYVVKRCHIN